MKLSNIFESLIREASGGNYEVRFNLAPTTTDETGLSIKKTWQVKDNGSVKPLDISLLDFIKVDNKGDIPTDTINPEQENISPEQKAINDFKESDMFKSRVSVGGVTNNFDADNFYFKLGNCTLLNDSLTTAYQIKCQSQKTVVAGVGASEIKVYFGKSSAGGVEVEYNPRKVPHWLQKIKNDPFMNIEGNGDKFTSMGMEAEDKKGKKIEKLNIKKGKGFSEGIVYCSCTNKVVPPPPTKYFYLKIGGVQYIKVVDEGVNNYKVGAQVYKIIDGLSGINLQSNGNKLYIA
jgi:hypothetical protein